MMASQEDDVRLVTKHFSGFECREVTDEAVIAITSALDALRSCSKALALVPMPGAINASTALRYLVGVARQLRAGTYSIVCKNSVLLLCSYQMSKLSNEEYWYKLLGSE